MSMRNVLLCAMIALGSAAMPAAAQITINIGVAPPAPHYEMIPAPRSGYVWAPGYWGWNGDRHIWIRGRSIVQRDGYRWQPDRWDQRNNSYYRTAGHWQRDNGFHAIKMKKETKNKNHGNNGKHGRGGRHD